MTALRHSPTAKKTSSQKDGEETSSELDVAAAAVATANSIIIIRPPGTLFPKAFCFSRDVFI